MQAVESEIRVMRALANDNCFARLLTTFTTPTETVLVQEYIPGKSLLTVVN